MIAEHTYSHTQRPTTAQSMSQHNTFVTVYVRSYQSLVSRPQPQGEIGVMPPRGSAETQPGDVERTRLLACAEMAVGCGEESPARDSYSVYYNPS
jgi:hypothetical protein